MKFASLPSPGGGFLQANGTHNTINCKWGEPINGESKYVGNERVIQ